MTEQSRRRVRVYLTAIFGVVVCLNTGCPPNRKSSYDPVEVADPLPPLSLDEQYYEGCEEDVEKFPAPDSERIFQEIDFIGMSRNDVLEILGPASSIRQIRHVDDILRYLYRDGSIRKKMNRWLFHFRDDKVLSIQYFDKSDTNDCPDASSYDAFPQALLNSYERPDLRPEVLDATTINLDNRYYHGCSIDQEVLQGMCEYPELNDPARRAARRIYANFDFLDMSIDEVQLLFGDKAMSFHATRDNGSLKHLDYLIKYYFLYSGCPGGVAYWFGVKDGLVRMTRRRDINEERNCVQGPAFHDELADASYPGSEIDCERFRETRIDPETGNTLSTQGAFDASRRIMRRMNFFGMKPEEVIKLLREPKSKEVRRSDQSIYSIRYVVNTGEKSVTYTLFSPPWYDFHVSEIQTDLQTDLQTPDVQEEPISEPEAMMVPPLSPLGDTRTNPQLLGESKPRPICFFRWIALVELSITHKFSTCWPQHVIPAQAGIQ